MAFNRAESRDRAKLGMAIAESRPMTPTTIISSRRVNPAWPGDLKRIFIWRAFQNPFWRIPLVLSGLRANYSILMLETAGAARRSRIAGFRRQFPNLCFLIRNARPLATRQLRVFGIVFHFDS